MTITHGLLAEIERLEVSHLDSKPEMKNLALSSPIRRFAIQPSAYLWHFVPKSSFDLVGKPKAAGHTM